MKQRLGMARKWIIEHNRAAMAAVLAVCVVVTVVFAIYANKKESGEESVEVTTETLETEEREVSKQAMELNAYPAINEVVSAYFTARADGDMDTLIAINPSVGKSNTSRLFFEKMSAYVDGYNDIEVYTKIGPVENSYIAYIKYYLKLTGRDEMIPGMESYYMPMREDGSYEMVDRGRSDAAIEDYITEVSLQDDIVELNNKVVVEYNEMIQKNPEIGVVLDEAYEVVSAQVGTELAADMNETGEETPEEGGDGSAPETTEAPETSAEIVVEKVAATTTVNIRSSDSENADRIGKAQPGQEFEVVEMRPNGWVCVKYEDGQGFIKGEYLEVVAQSAAGGEGAAGEAAQTEDVTGTVTATTTVNIRAEASETAEKIGIAHEGEKLDLIARQADGWCKIRYSDRVGYVKSDFVN